MALALMVAETSRPTEISANGGQVVPTYIPRRVTTASISQAVYARLLALADGDAQRVSHVAGVLLHQAVGEAPLRPPWKPSHDAEPPEAPAAAPKAADFMEFFGTVIERAAQRKHAAAVRNPPDQRDDVPSGAELARRRVRLGLSQRQLAAGARIARGTYASIETGYRKLPRLRAQIQTVLDSLERLQPAALRETADRWELASTKPAPIREWLPQQSCLFCGDAYGDEAASGCRTCADLRDVVRQRAGTRR